MYAADEAATPAAVNQALGVIQAVGVAMLAGWLTERALDTGLRIPAVGPLCGLVGLWAGGWLWHWGGWDTGPLLGGVAVVPALAGTLGVCAILKLVSVGAAGPRW